MSFNPRLYCAVVVYASSSITSTMPTTATSSPATSVTPTPATTSNVPSPAVTVTSYDDTQCSISGSSTILSTITGSTWPGCMQWGENILGQAQGIISWNYGNGQCIVVGGNGTVSTSFNPRTYCAVVQYVAIPSTTSTIPTTASALPATSVTTTPVLLSTVSSPVVNVTSYEDTQCYISGSSTILSTTKQGAWLTCLNFGTGIIGQAQGII